MEILVFLDCVIAYSVFSPFACHKWPSMRNYTFQFSHVTDGIIGYQWWNVSQLCNGVVEQVTHCDFSCFLRETQHVVFLMDKFHKNEPSAILPRRETALSVYLPGAVWAQLQRGHETRGCQPTVTWEHSRGHSHPGQRAIHLAEPWRWDDYWNFSRWIQMNNYNMHSFFFLLF